MTTQQSPETPVSSENSPASTAEYPPTPNSLEKQQHLGNALPKTKTSFDASFLSKKKRSSSSLEIASVLGKKNSFYSLSKKSSSSNSIATSSSHTFTVTSFLKPTFCGVCSGFIWGISGQGLNCSECGISTHHKCAPRTSACGIEAENTAFFDDLLTAAHSESEKLESVRDNFMPPLSVTRMLRNNARFVARQHLFTAIDVAVIELVTWKSQPITFLFLFAVVVVCTNTFIIPYIPLAGLFVLMVVKYHARVILSQSGARPIQHVLGTSPKITLTAQETKIALNQIQNTMGNVSDVYDLGYNMYKCLDWSDFDRTLQIFYIVIASFPIVFVVLFVFPVSYIIMVATILVFLANTATVRAIARALFDSRNGTGASHVGKLLKTTLSASASLTSMRVKKSVVKVCTVYENQRWWAGIGFAPLLLPGERGTWTSETGEHQLPKDLIEPFMVVDTTEQVKEVWVWNTEWNSIGEGEGWMYSSQNWENPRPDRGYGSFTRVRKWERQLSLQS